MSVHNGHRKRLKNRFLKEDLDNFEPINVLELVLFYAIPRKDTNEIAHALLDKFGTIDRVFTAPFEELTEVSGVGSEVATLIKLVPSISRYFIKASEFEGKFIRNVEDACKFTYPNFVGIVEEAVLMVSLDSKGKIIAKTFIAKGSAHSVTILVRNVLKEAIVRNATSVIIAHNHPDGIALPSKDDLIATAELKKSLDAVDVVLLDHIIVAGGDCVSLSDSGFIR